MKSGTPVNSAPLAASARTYTVTGLKNAQAYYFTVKAINAIGTGAPSNEAGAIPQATAFVPGAPGAVKAVAGAGKGHGQLGGAGLERRQCDHRVQRLQGDGTWR